MKKTLKGIGITLTVLCLSCLPKVASAARNAGPAAHTDSNPLIGEMLILDKTFREVVSAVALGEGGRVHKALESMHGTMEKTHEGVNSGTVTLPKNPRNVEEFVRLDSEFHANLERLDSAALRDAPAKMLLLTKKLLDSCVGCHKNFRK